MISDGSCSCSDRESHRHRHRHRHRRRRRPERETSSDCAPPKRISYETVPSCWLIRLVVVATIFLPWAESFQIRSSVGRQQKAVQTPTGWNRDSACFPNRLGSSPNKPKQTTNLTFVTARFAEPNTKPTLEKETGTVTTILSNEDEPINRDVSADAANHSKYSIKAIAQNGVDERNGHRVTEIELLDEQHGAVTRRDAFRYGTILTSAVLVTAFTFAQMDPSSESPRQSIIPTTSVKSFARLEPVNITKVASQTNINVTMNRPKMCVSIDSQTFNKVERPKRIDWLPSWASPKWKVIEETPNSQLLVAATVAGSITEMARTGLLYPLQTVKTRLQVDRNVQMADYGPRQPPSLSEQISVLASNIRKKIDDGDLYAGISPTLLVSVPATGIYFGIRDVTKRLLVMTPLDPTWVAVGGALVGDVVSLCFRVPSDALAMRLQVQTNSTGDWLGDSFKRLPMVILTDLPYLASKIVLNKMLIQGSLSVSEYALYAGLASALAGVLTTPFDVVRTRILLNEVLVVEDDDHLLERGNLTTTLSDNALLKTPYRNPGYSVLRTMVQITKEGDGGISNLFQGWLERVVYLGIGRAWLEPLQLIGYIGIRDAVLLEWL